MILIYDKLTLKIITKYGDDLTIAWLVENYPKKGITKYPQYQLNYEEIELLPELIDIEDVRVSKMFELELFYYKAILQNFSIEKEFDSLNRKEILQLRSITGSLLTEDNTLLQSFEDKLLTEKIWISSEARTIEELRAYKPDTISWR